MDAWERPHWELETRNHGSKELIGKAMRETCKRKWKVEKRQQKQQEDDVWSLFSSGFSNTFISLKILKQ